MNRPIPDPVGILREPSRAPVTCICFHGNHLFSGNQLGVVQVWECARRRVVHRVQAHGGEAVLCITVLGTGQALTHGRDGYIQVWSIGELSWTIQESLACTSMGFCACLPLSLGNTLHVAAPSDESAILLTHVAAERRQHVLSAGRNHGMCMCMCQKQEQDNAVQLIAGYEDGNLVAWDLNSKERLSVLECFKDTIMAVDYHSGLNKGVCSSVGENIVIWTINEKQCIVSLKTITLTNPGVSCVKFRLDGKILALGGWDSQGRLFSAKKNTVLAVLTFHSQTVRSLAFAPDNTLALGSKDGAISLWDLYK